MSCVARGKECNARIRQVVGGQPQALGGWAAATCETHERGEAWDGDVTLPAWIIVDICKGARSWC